MNSASCVFKIYSVLLSCINRFVKKKYFFYLLMDMSKKYLFLNNTVTLMALNPTENPVWALNQFVVLIYGN